MPTHRTTASVLRLREKPTNAAAILGRLPLNSTVDVLQDNTKGWAQVKAKLLDGSLTGWVSTVYLEPVKSAVPAAEPKGLTIARAEIGVQEYPGPERNTRIIEHLH